MAAVAAVWAAVARVEAARVDVGARHDFQRVENLQLQNPALSRPVISRITGAQALRGVALYGAIRFSRFSAFWTDYLAPAAAAITRNCESTSDPLG